MPNGDEPDQIEVVGPAQPLGLRWEPMVGQETEQLLRKVNLPQDGAERLRSEAWRTLARCVPPGNGQGRETGLIVGYVQSGKTMSFTTVSALALDNRFRLVIVIAGISTYLFDQSRRRLDDDLRIRERRARRWQHFPNPLPEQNTIQTIAGALGGWRNPNVPPALRTTVLITVMKNRKRLDDLIQVLSALELNDVPTLIIDDEADQAGLNTLVQQRNASATYRRLLAIRDRLPLHTFLQYTATPQAPLLINLIDMLSPSFAEVLTPGPEYVGGQQFFVERPDLIRIIPTAEIPTRTAPLAEPPRSLLEAMRIFFLGVAAAYLRGEVEDNRSMMVHPSQRIMQHAEYFTWVTGVKEEWQRTLGLPENDPDRRDLTQDFQRAYDDLAATVAELPALNELLGLLSYAISSTTVTQVNSQGSTEIDWRSAYPHILVGGQAMDRGFTVEGLTVTYMPRGMGTRQADTLQQRARFFGYKRRYLDYCRVYLEQRVRDAYRTYVEHEEDVRARLIEHRNSGRPLSEWRRAFFLDPDLRPTRRFVLDLDYMQDRYSDRWFTPKSPHYTREALQANRQTVQQFLGRLALQQDPGSPDRTQEQIHAYAPQVPLRLAFDELLTRLYFSRPEDSQPFLGIRLQIEEYLQQNPQAMCAVYHMSQGQPRVRGLDRVDKILNLYQGEAPVEPRELRGSVYPGDQAIKAAEGLTIQIHNLALRRGDAEPFERDVPTVALWVPSEMAAGWLVQEPPPGA